MNRRVSSRRVLVTGLKGGEESLLGITKSGTSAKGEMRLVPKPKGGLGALECDLSLVVRFVLG